MRIAVYKNNMTTGRGADRAVADLCGVLAETHEVLLVTGEGAALAYPVDPRVEVARIPLESTALAERLQAIKPNLIISTGTDEIRDLDAAFPAAFPAPVVQQFHIFPPSAFKPRRWLRNARTKRALRRCAAIQVLLGDFVEVTRKVLKYGGRIAAIGNIAPELRPLPPAAGAPVIIYPAAFHKDKRQALLLRAFALLKKRVPDARLILAGKGKAKDVGGLRQLARRLGIAESVDFPGYIGDLRTAFAAASVVAFPSRMEGFALTLVESAAAGRLVVGCTDCLASCNLIPMSGGLLAKPEPVAFAQALERALSAAADYAVPPDAFAAFSRENIRTQWNALIASLLG